MMRARHGKKLVMCVMGIVLSCMFSSVAYAQAGVSSDVPALTAQSSRAVAKEIEPALQRFVDQQKRLPTQAKQVLVKATPDPVTGIVWIDLDSGYLPKDAPVFTEDFGALVRDVENEGYELIAGVVKFRYIKVRIGGKEINEIYPPEHLKKKRAGASTSAAAAPVAGLVVLNPGHGKYLNHSDETWRYQRPTPYVGTADIYEDTVTPGYSSMLASLLTERSANTATSIKHTRDIGNTNIDPESGLAWAALGARYYLKRLYPALGATIWNKFPNGSPSRKQPDRANLREYDDDIRARPEYANYLNAETLISLHTDASDNVSARGATVIANINDADSNQLGLNIHCYVTEQIRQLPAYSTYPIRPGVRDGANYGEVREASMPTALIEIGFHSNADDSTALRNSVFRAAAMRGVEKGYRTFKSGETTCLPFKIASIPTASGKFRVRFPVPVTLQGHPRFPVTVVTVPVSCPSTWTCNNKTNSFTKAVDNVVTTTYYCDAPSTKPAASFKWKTTVKDADGVVTAAVEHMTSCSAGT
ncbi:N-acetylmuramoyl-L-alanine amidase [Xanthomonas citri pv. citri]|uniref:N-acetylmuramoyl-L-alanine amidase n=3 Tax=Gammaproteobacteria TaxID=1236 RepID=A0AAI7ZHG8_XANAC|nr:MULTISPECIES: N-acetylmuramoyl-L-alanine amidase [Xanthomonas]AAM38123.1 hypothetical protein XAC3279 [Xanthomonas citri pv. citri str. 306]AGH78762.1 hypothetical protein XAC29_16715 [Xanthomonas axonopodis Xac29-1]AJD69872.1 hypothetical protein J151_03463 [Xanthomonas citri subsp. citri A306]AJY83384.1 N-acetylmuramoyl-L-alanine amidase [Xanthomonas citri pv. citri]AJY87810.1 N-acetylmuramoyl-L-alanine amidase [Xanthomonas citri subsp. citri UI6]